MNFTRLCASVGLAGTLLFTHCGSDEPVVAEAGDDQTVSLCDGTVALDGRASSGPEELRFLWSISERPDGSAASINTPNLSHTTLIPDLPGDYVIGLEVSADGKKDTDSIRISMTSTHRNNENPTSSFIADCDLNYIGAVQRGQELCLSGRMDDPSDFIQRFIFDASAAGSLDLELKVFRPDMLSLQLMVTDSDSECKRGGASIVKFCDPSESCVIQLRHPRDLIFLDVMSFRGVGGYAIAVRPS